MNPPLNSLWWQEFVCLCNFWQNLNIFTFYFYQYWSLLQRARNKSFYSVQLSVASWQEIPVRGRVMWGCPAPLLHKDSKIPLWTGRWIVTISRQTQSTFSRGVLHPQSLEWKWKVLHKDSSTLSIRQINEETALWYKWTTMNERKVTDTVWAVAERSIYWVTQL